MMHKDQLLSGSIITGKGNRKSDLRVHLAKLEGD